MKHKHRGIPELELVTAHNDMVMNTWNFSVTSRIVGHGDLLIPYKTTLKVEHSPLFEPSS